MNKGIRIGIGYDVHRLVKGRRCVIGGVEIENELGLLGHSDADVLSHAVADAILGAAALPDIGFYFPPGDAACKDIDSLKIIARAVEEVEKLGFRIVNVDSAIVAETPKLLPHVQKIKEALAKVLKVSPQDVGVKATTNEGMGWQGRKEGVSAQAVCVISSL